MPSQKFAASQPAAANQPWDWKVPGFSEALKDSLGPYVDIEPVWTLQEMEDKVGMKIINVSRLYNQDPRGNNNPTVVQARAIVEEFVRKSMDAISQLCYDKPWLYKVNFTGPLFSVALHQFGPKKLFGRVLAPALEKYVEDGIFTWAEEERIAKGFADALEACGISNTKKGVAHLQKAYDEAYFKAPYGSHRHAQSELGMLQDFIKGWMQEFADRAHGIIGQGAQAGQEVTWLAMLFQNLCSPERACLPHELTSMIKDPPKTPWDFINQCAMECWVDWQPSEGGKKKKKKSGGMGEGLGEVPPAAAAVPQAAAQYAAQPGYTQQYAAQQDYAQQAYAQQYAAQLQQAQLNQYAAAYGQRPY